MNREEKKPIEIWNERYRRGEHSQDAPLPLLGRMTETLAPGRALDIACGPGRHALLLAERGWQVTAVDASQVAVEMLQARAKDRGLIVDTRIADLESGEFTIEPNAYDLIGDFYYLQRNLFPSIRAGVRPGGLFIAAIHIVDDAPGAQPMNPKFLLQKGELRASFEGWAILHYYEGRPADEGHHHNVAEIAARRP